MVGCTLRWRVWGACAGLLVACEVRGLVGSNVGGGGEGGTDATTGALDTGGPTGDGETHAEGEGGQSTGVRFDVPLPDAPPVCVAPIVESCDATSDDPLESLGLNCPDGPTAVGSFRGAPTARMVHAGTLGTYGVFSPREGERFMVLSTGIAAHLPLTPAELQVQTGCAPIACPSTQHSTQALATLPEPISVRNVSDEGVDCLDEPSLIGTGDCSNTIEQQFQAGNGAFDYTEMRIEATVPELITGLSYHFAFFTAEYPTWANHGTPFNDMYIAWLQSEQWTGNISFDEDGRPISVGAAFLDFKDADSPTCEEMPCVAPELGGFSMEGHAGTRWLLTEAAVQPGEDITLVLSLFDMNDGIYDSMVILDDFEWTCNGAAPVTTPVG